MARALYSKDTPIALDENIANLSTSPEEMVKMLLAIYNNDFLDKKSCDEMIDIMKRCQTNERIPKLLPKIAPVAHKTGSLVKVANDAGIVYTEKGNYLLVLFYNGYHATDEEFKPNTKGHLGDYLLAQLSKEIYDYVVAQ